MRVLVFQNVTRSLFFEFVTGPFWWYTRGLARVALWWRESAGNSWRRLDVPLWAKNIGVPMFGQFDWAGRLISFFIRLFQIIVRTILFVLVMLALSGVIALWAVAPIFVLVMVLLPFA